VKLAAVLVLAVAGIWAWTFHRQNQNEHALAAVASDLAGRHVGVECQGFFAELVDIGARDGEVQFPQGRAPDHTFLTRRTCKTLERFRKGSRGRLDCLTTVDWARWRFDTDYGSPCSQRARGTAEAINTLAHESMHLRGFVDEGQTQCYGIQEDAWTVVRLGGTPEQGAAVASFVLALQPGMPSEYQSSECRAGGGLDLHPETAVFPAEAVPALPPAELRGPALSGQ
jgi:hypothetical protein